MPVVVSVSGVQYSGSWSLSGQANAKAAGTWPALGNQLFAVGLNTSGQLGLGNTTNYSSLKQVGTLTNWSMLSIAQDSKAAIKTDGTLWTWGNSQYGQLGLGNRTSYSSPKQVGSLTNWATLVNGGRSILAVKTDGTLWAWGYNAYGCLGLGNLTYYSSPKQVGSLTNWSSVSMGVYVSAAIKTDGTLWAWGINNAGQLGLGNTTYSFSSPQQVGSLTNWSIIKVNSSFMVAIKTDGTLWSWGVNTSGQLGLGNRTNYSSPKQVGLLTTWTAITAGGGSYVLAVQSNNTLWAWGANYAGMLGTGNLTYYSSPKQVGSLTNWLTVTAGPQGTNVGAIKTDGTLWTWGNGLSGGLGLGNETYYSSPKQVGSQTYWKYVSVNANSTAAINLAFS